MTYYQWVLVFLNDVLPVGARFLVRILPVGARVPGS